MTKYELLTLISFSVSMILLIAVIRLAIKNYTVTEALEHYDKAVTSLEELINDLDERLEAADRYTEYVINVEETLDECITKGFKMGIINKALMTAVDEMTNELQKYKQRDNEGGN